MNMNALGQNALSSLTGNLPKAILCVRKMNPDVKVGSRESMKQTASAAANLQKKLLERTQAALNSASQTFSSLTGTDGAMASSGYLALEVQYNPNSIYLDTQAGRQVERSGGSLGTAGTNQITQINQPTSTTLSFQLVFDDMNPDDAFMLENIAPTVGNAVSAGADMGKKGAKKGVKKSYSVQAQIDGLMSLLTRAETRQVIFYWAKMCFRGELISVNSRYTMFNKDGNPIRGTVELSIRQGDESAYEYDETYWNSAFDKAFGIANDNAVSGVASKFQKATDNNFLNLRL